MLVTIKSFGSLWSRRIGKDLNDPKRFVRATYYNTTGIQVGRRIQHRWKTGAGGEIKFYGLASGLDPNYPSRSLNQTFESGELEIWRGHNRVVVKRQVSHVERPDYFLIVTTAEHTGGLLLDEETSKSEDVVVVSVSQWREQQEVMLLMPAFSWVRGKLGTFFVEPSQDKLLNGLLRLEPSF
jgi:hypothetical protein